MTYYTTESGIEITCLTDFATAISGIMEDYGDLPMYYMDYTAGIEDELPVGVIVIRNTSMPSEGHIKPLRLLIK